MPRAHLHVNSFPGASSIYNLSTIFLHGSRPPIDPEHVIRSTCAGLRDHLNSDEAETVLFPPSRSDIDWITMILKICHGERKFCGEGRF
jgi:hypothetical protein